MGSLDGPVHFEEDEDEYLFSEYSIDDTLDSLTRLERYHGSDFSLQRMVLVRDITDTAKEAGHEATIKRLLPLLPAFVNDSEPVVRQALAEQMHALAEFMVNTGTPAQREEGYNEVLNSFLPFTIELLSDKNTDVGGAAIQALLKVCNLVRPEHFEAHVISLIQQLAHDKRAEDYRAVAAQLCDELAPLLGKELCLAKIVPEFQTLAADNAFAVRKTIAGHLGKLSETIGETETVDKLFPIYETLAVDMIWGVRKACAESVPAISRCVTPEIRAGKLSEIFLEYLVDISRWVRVSAVTNLGQYLHTFGGPEECPTKLVEVFASMAESTSDQDSDYPELCAYSFPAVALTVGTDRWCELEAAFLKLMEQTEWKVRRTLSCSLHETAKIVGREVTEKTLSQAFDLFLRDLDEVKVGCLQHVAEFLEVMGPEKREQYIPQMCAMTDTSDSWRLRMLIGSTLGDLAHLLKVEFCRTELVPLAIKMMEDSVSEVRQAMYVSVAKILKRLREGTDNCYSELLESILSCASASSFQRRQMLPHIAQELVLLGEKDFFLEHFLDSMEGLSKDRVANVRIIVARCFTEIVEHSEELKTTPRVDALVQQLQDDSDRDVAHFAGSELLYDTRDQDRLENEDLREADAADVKSLQQPTAESVPVHKDTEAGEEQQPEQKQDDQQQEQASEDTEMIPLEDTPESANPETNESKPEEALSPELQETEAKDEGITSEEKDDGDAVA